MKKPLWQGGSRGLAARGCQVSLGSTEFTNKTQIKRQIFRTFKIQHNMTSPKLQDFTGQLPSTSPLTQFLKLLELLTFNQKSGKPLFIYV